jgi:hypothetical protein
MQINMTTFAGRAVTYVHDTLRSLFSSDWQDAKMPVNLIVGSEDDSHVREYASHPFVRIVPWDMKASAYLRWNCTLNKIRALRYGDDETTLVCEDDISFAPDWLSALTRATGELANEEYVLSLFAATPDLEKAPLASGKTLVKDYPTRVLQGAQSVYYPTRAIRYKVATYLKHNLTRACGDELIGRCAREHATLYATKEILVNHVGSISCFHRDAP